MGGKDTCMKAVLAYVNPERLSNEKAAVVNKYKYICKDLNFKFKFLKKLVFTCWIIFSCIVQFECQL